MVEGGPFLLEAPPPLDLGATLESGQAHRWQKDGDVYWGVVYGSLLKVRQVPKGIEIFSDPELSAASKAMLGSYFRLDDDLPAIYEEINRDDRMDGMIRRYSGLRLLRQEPWECLSAFICSATSNIPRIAANMESMADAFGEPRSLHGRVRCTFPPAHRIAEAGEDALRELALGFRAKWLANAAIQVAEGELDLEEVRRLPYWEARARLTELPGIGAKIADCVLVFSLDKLEAFPIDRWVSRAVQEWYLNGQTMKYDDIVHWAHDYFGRYAGYAQQYLFHGGRLGKVGRAAAQASKSKG